MAVALFLMGHAYVYGAQLNPYAYDVKAQLSGTNIELSYKLNAAATSTDIIVYCNEIEIGRQHLTAVDSNAVGAHTATIDLSAFNQAGNCTVGIKVNGNSPAQPTQLKNGTSAVTYSLYHPKGVAIDKNPASPYFGRILTDECMLHSKSSGYISCPEKNGIYAFDPAFQQIHNGSGYAFKGGLTYTAKMTNGSTNAYAPYRIRISQSGRIFVTMQDDHHGLIYEASADLQTFTPIVSNYTINGRQAMNASLDLKDNQDGSISLLALNCNSRGIGFNNTGWELTEFTVAVDGTISSRVVMDSAAIISVIGFQKDVDPIEGTDPAGNHWRTVLTASNTQFQYAADGGYWFINSRSNDYEAAFAHVKADGTWDMVMARIEGSTAAANSGDFYGGAGFVEIGDKVFVGMNRYTSANGKIGVFTVDYSGTNTPVTLDSYITAEVIGRNINDFAYDPAYNLYAAGNSGEKIIAVALPYSGQVETPVVLPSNVVLPLVDHLYEIGDNQPNRSWDPVNSNEMVMVEPNVFEGTFTFTNNPNNGDPSYFAFTTVKPATADWDLVNTNRFGGATNNKLVADESFEAMAKGNYGFTVNAGTYKLRVDLNEMKLSVTQIYDALYELGDNQGWSLTSKGTMTQTASNVFEGDFLFGSSAENAPDYTNYFAFTISSSTSDWSDINNYRFSGATEDLEVADGDKIILGKHGDRSLTIADGYYHFKVDMNKKTLEVSKKGDCLIVTEAGYATYYNGVAAYEMPTGMTGYVFNVANRLEQVYDAGDIVPAATPLVLGAAEGTYDLVFTTGGVAPGANSLLVGSDEAVMTNTLVSGNHIYYGLSLNSAGEASSVGFYWMAENGGAFENAAHKAFLAVPVLTYQDYFLAPAIRFEENNATNIQNIEGQEKAVKFIQNGQIFIRKDGVVYDAMGRVIR